VDLTVAGGRSSPEIGLAASPGHDDLPRGMGDKRAVRGT
jgi:hypothetical protein